MEAIVKSNIEYLIEVLRPMDEVKTNLYLMGYLNGILKTDGKNQMYWCEALSELQKVIDTVHVNKCGMSTHVVVERLSNLLPCKDILQAISIVNVVWNNPYSKERIKQSVLRAQTITINRAKAAIVA